MIKINEAVIVEGKYDKIRVGLVANAQIITTDGFGIFKKDESAMIVSRGLSVAEIPRIFNRPEIAFIKLKSGKAQK